MNIKADDCSVYKVEAFVNGDWVELIRVYDGYDVYWLIPGDSLILDKDIISDLDSQWSSIN